MSDHAEKGGSFVLPPWVLKKWCLSHDNQGSLVNRRHLQTLHVVSDNISYHNKNNINNIINMIILTSCEFYLSYSKQSSNSITLC